MAPKAMPTPIPALAPVDRPLLVSAHEGFGLGAPVMIPALVPVGWVRFALADERVAVEVTLAVSVAALVAW